MGKGIWIAVVVIVLVIGLFLFTSNSNRIIDEETVNASHLDIHGEDHAHDEFGNHIEGDSAPDTEDIRGQVGVHEVNMTVSGFSPRTLNINIGDTVVFVNQGASRWPASDLHPSHRNYPGSGIEKCGTAEEEGIFDSCGAVKDTWTFKFENDGEWTYHDHLSPGIRGTILVV